MEDRQGSAAGRAVSIAASRMVLAALACFLLAILTALSPGWISPALLAAVGFAALASAAVLGRHALPSDS